MSNYDQESLGKIMGLLAVEFRESYNAFTFIRCTLN